MAAGSKQMGLYAQRGAEAPCEVLPIVSQLSAED